MNASAYRRMTQLERQSLLATAKRVHIRIVDRHDSKTGDFYKAYQATIRGVVIIHKSKTEWLTREEALTAGRTVLQNLKSKTNPK